MRIDDKDQRIASILDAAEQVFARYGYQQTNMELLAREAKLSRQGLYLSFRSKGDVFAAVIERIQNESLNDAFHDAEKVRARGGNAVDIITAQINARANAFLLRLKGSPYVTELYEESARICPEIVDEHSRRFVSDVTATIEAEYKAGRLNLPNGISAKKAAQLIVAAARGLKLTNPAPSSSEFKRDLAIIVSLFFCTK
jgi:AcrR family transcriptional regulator